MTAENYHLKWDSHATYLNSSVATLYKNENYADVVLYSSTTTPSTTNAIPCMGISAHKFILSSCSQYFSTIFETSPVANNGPFYIVLPPDLSHRAIQILVQYMYMGEATVSNDILKEVLKGGEILKIRGLCRTNTSPVTNLNPNQNGGQASYNLTRMPNLNTIATPVRYLVEQQPQVIHSRGGLIASVLPKDSPVIIKTAKPLTALAAASTHATMGKLAANAITVNKHMAIDPGDSKRTYTTHDPVATTTTIASVAREDSSSICQEIGCNGCTLITTNPPQQIIIPRDHNGSIDASKLMCTKSCLPREEYVPHIAPNDDCLEEDPSELYEQEMELTKLSGEPFSEEMHEYATTHDEDYNYTNHLVHAPPNQQAVMLETGEMQHLVSTSPPQESTTYVAIKEEPAEWLNPSCNTMDTMKKTAAAAAAPLSDFKVPNIKSEPPTTSTSSCHDTDHPMPSGSRIVKNDFERYFVCDICKKACDDKSSLLRHLETHSATPCTSGGYNASCTVDVTTASTSSTLNKSYVPKKRRRTSQQENSTDHVCLQCDLCTTRFETPAEWVRHMSSQHTDVELAILNSKKDSEKTKSTNPSSTNGSSSSKKFSGNLQTQQQPPQQQQLPPPPQQQQQLQPQQHQLPQRVQVLSGSTNSNLPVNSTSVLCTSNQEAIGDTNFTDNLRPTMSPA